jgi:TolB-like protein/AraC-like DNA-binding protein/Tfp pilus assembly protein PilF
MSQTLSMEQVFLNKLNEIIESNLHNEQFGVAEISREMDLSRSGIHRRLKSITKKSLTRYVREYRLQKAMEMLRHHEATAAEIAFRVGFSSPAYFNKCFHEYYGYPPGEVRKLERHESESAPYEPEVFNKNSIQKKIFTILSVTFFALLILLLLFYFSDFSLFKNLIGSKVDRIKDPDQSIVVLPFKNLSEDPGNQYFADGIMEDVLNNLIRIRDIRVISRTTAEHFRGSSLTSPQIAEELHVGYVLEGSVLKYENKARIFVQLIDARHDQHIWSEKYDRELTDIFTVQSDIAKNIARELETVLSEKEIERIDKVPTRSSPAYDLYLRGRFFWNKRTEEGLKKAIVYFEQSVAADPDYALAYAGLADAYFIQSVWKWCPRANGYARAKLMAQKAIEIDNNLAEAHATLGGVFTWWDWKWEDARKEFLFAISCNPDYAMARQYYAELLFLLGENEEARRQINTALELDPLSLINRQVSAYQFYYESRTAEAMDEIKIIQEIDSTFVSSLWIPWKFYIAKGEGLKALETV